MRSFAWAGFDLGISATVFADPLGERCCRGGIVTLVAVSPAQPVAGGEWPARSGPREPSS